MRFEGHVAMVSGATSAFGRAIALAFAKEGADVVVASRNLGALENVADQIRALGRQALAVKTDVSNSAEVSQLVEKAIDKFKKIDILVNIAAVVKRAPAEEIAEADWDTSIDVNLKGQFLCCQAVGRHMIKQKHGKIINIASTAGYQATVKTLPYATSKAGVLQLTKVLAVEWAKYNINVNSLCPGLILSGMVEQTRREYPDFIDDMAKAIPLKRANTPEDVSGAVLFLASSESGNITGQNITVDGGRSALHPGCVKTL